MNKKFIIVLFASLIGTFISFVLFFVGYKDESFLIFLSSIALSVYWLVYDFSFPIQMDVGQPEPEYIPQMKKVYHKDTGSLLEVYDNILEPGVIRIPDKHIENEPPNFDNTQEKAVWDGKVWHIEPVYVEPEPVIAKSTPPPKVDSFKERTEWNEEKQEWIIEKIPDWDDLTEEEQHENEIQREFEKKEHQKMIDAMDEKTKEVYFKLQKESEMLTEEQKLLNDFWDEYKVNYKTYKKDGQN